MLDDLAARRNFLRAQPGISRTVLSTKSPGLPYTAFTAGTSASTMGAMKPGSFVCFATTSQAASTAPATLVPENNDQRRSQMLGTIFDRAHGRRVGDIAGISHDEQLAQPDAAEDQLR